MKHTLKKVVSILLSVLMLVSLCTVAFAETTEDPQPTDFGLYSGTGIGEYVADPAGSGETVIKAKNGNATLNYRLADDEGNAFVVESGKYYTITFDYLVNTGTNGTDDSIFFSPFYGVRRDDKDDALDGTPGRKKVTGDIAYSGISESFIGDGKWHSAAVSFLADPIEVTDGENNTELLDHIFISYTDKNSFDGYFKNFNIVEETEATGLYTDRFTTDMKAHLDCMTDDTYGSATMTATPADGTGNLILSGGSKKYPTVGYTGWLTHRAIFDSSKTLYKIYPGTTYTITLKYRVTNNPGFVYVGIGYALNGTASTNGETYVANVKKDTTTTDWQTLTAVFDPSSSLQSGKTQAFPRVILSSSTADGAIEIESVEIVGSGMPNAPVITFNDNGEIENHVAYAGSSITLKGDNGYLGEESDGWCTDTALTEVTDVIPSTSTSLYAKYDAVVIDNFNFEKLVKGYDYTNTAVLNDGSITVSKHTNNTALMLPAYDAPATNGSGGYDYYQFVKGSEYIVIIDYANITEDTADINRSLHLIGAKSANQDGERDTKIIHQATPEFSTSANESVSGTAVYHFTRAAGKNGWDECGMAIRSETLTSSYTATIEKIIITKVDDNTPFAAVYTPDAETDWTFVAIGAQAELPKIEDTETEFFAGWYRAGNRISEETGRLININDIALPGYYLADQGGFFELDANMISKGSIKVDFSESDYTENPLESYDIGGSFSIVTDDEIDTEGKSDDKTYLRLNSTSGNIYKTSFFDDNGKRVLCYNDVTYNFEIRYKVITPDTSSKNSKYIGICRYAKGKYAPRDLDGSGNASRLVKVDKTTDTFKTASQTVKVENLYVGNTETAGYYQSQLGIMVCSGDIYIDYVTITPVSYDPTYTIQDTEKGNISVDYATGTVTVTPNEGYELASKNAINVSMTYGDVVKSSTINFVDDQNNLDLNTEDGINYTFDTTIYSDYAQKIGALRFDATFVESGTTANAAFIAVSGRQEKEVGNDGEYQSAGIRFRSRFSASTVDNASEIGFIIVPKKAITNAGLATVTEYLDAVAAGTVEDRSAKGVAYNAEAEKHVIYKELNGFHDYQAVLTGLTSEDGTTDLTSLYMMVAAYIEYADGTTTYIELVTAYKVDKATGAITQE